MPDLRDALINVFAIFVALLLNVQVLVIGELERTVSFIEEVKYSDEKLNALKDRGCDPNLPRYLGYLLELTLNNVSFAILLSFVLLIALLVSRFAVPHPLLFSIGSGVIVALLSSFVLTVMMVMSRIHLCSKMNLKLRKALIS